MSQIEIQILKQGFKSNKILSVSFFTLQDPYRDFTKYQKYLERFYGYAKRDLPDFELRVYTDDTGKDFALRSSESQDHVSVYYFNCPQFKEGSGHQGLFGAMIRFLPLFEKHHTVWISDIDISEYFLDKSLLTKMSTNKCDFLICPYSCYFRKSFNQKYTIIAHRIISRIQLPKALFTRFLNKLLEGKINTEIKYLNDENIAAGKHAYTVPYCTDELFLNTSVYKHLQTYDYKFQIESDLMVSVGLIDNVMRLLNDEQHLTLYRYSKRRDPKYKDATLKLLKHIFKIHSKKYLCFKDLEKKIDQGIIEESFTVKSSEL
jgi:hypothetical protein